MLRVFTVVNKYVNLLIMLVCFNGLVLESLSSISEVLGSNPPLYSFFFFFFSLIKTKAVFISDCISRASTRLCEFFFVVLPERNLYRLCEDAHCARAPREN